MELLKPDLCIIGAGAAGLAAAAGAAALRVPVVLVEKGEFGGARLEREIPLEALAATANAVAAARRQGALGLIGPRPVVDFAAVGAHLRDVVAALRPNDGAERYGGMFVRVVRAEARFVSPRRVEAGDVAIEARRFILATGAEPAPASIPGLDLLHPLTDAPLPHLRELPARLAIIGAGAHGVGLAQSFRRLGAAVTLIDHGPGLADHDAEIAAIAFGALAREGVDSRLSTGVAAIEPRAGGALLRLDDGATVEASHVLVATGRRPRLDGLGLERAEIVRGAGGLTFRSPLRTTNRSVYAIGGCVGAASAQAGMEQAGLALGAILFRRKIEWRPERVARIVRCDPEIAAIGLTEEAARAGARDFRVLRFPFSETVAARAERRAEGHVKALVTPRGAILGVSIVGAGAADLLAPWALALRKGLNVADLAASPAPPPSRSEASRRAALGFYERKAGSPWVARALRFFRQFG